MIPDEAVEAAVKAWDRHWGARYGDDAMDEMGEEVRIALEAAAPHMLAEAWDEGCEAMHATTGGEWPPIHEDNPYRSQT